MKSTFPCFSKMLHNVLVNEYTYMVCMFYVLILEMFYGEPCRRNDSALALRINDMGSIPLSGVDFFHCKYNLQHLPYTLNIISWGYKRIVTQIVYLRKCNSIVTFSELTGRDGTCFSNHLEDAWWLYINPKDNNIPQ